MERGTIAPFKTEIEKPPVLIKRNGLIQIGNGINSSSSLSPVKKKKSCTKDF